MNQTLAPPLSVQPPLYDLLARSWSLPAAVTSACFDLAGKSCAFALDDGRLALMPLDDADSALNRVRVEADSGRSLIRAREKPPGPPLLTEGLAEGAPMLAASGIAGFLVAGRCGSLYRVTPRGQVLRLARPEHGILALASDGRGRLALAFADKVSLHDETDMAPRGAVPTHGPAHGLAFAPDLDLLAIQTATGLMLRGPHGPAQLIEQEGTGTLVFSADGTWLAGSTCQGFWLRRSSDGKRASLGNFRQPPRSLAFSRAADAVFASGAFRLAGWSLATPPFDAPATGALRSGGAGLVLTESVAAHPTRNLVASGRADGAVLIVQVGRPDEMLLRHGQGSAVTALAWSQDGLHLAMGTAEGGAALLALPPQLFR